MRASLLTVVSGMARFAASQSIISPVIQQRQTTNQSCHIPLGSLIDGAATKPPACSVSSPTPPFVYDLFPLTHSLQLKCVLQSGPATSSSLDPIQALCSKHVDPVVADKLQTCLFSSCTLQELLQAKRSTASLCHEKQTDLGPMIMGVIWASKAISVIAIVLRVLARTVILETSILEASTWGWDDTVIMAALFANLASGVWVSLGKLLLSHLQHGMNQLTTTALQKEITTC